MEDTSRTLSVMEENQVQEILQLLYKKSFAAGNIEGDIYRNRFLSSLRNPPQMLTPDGDFLNNQHAFHESIRVEELKESPLWESFMPLKKRHLMGSHGARHSRSSGHLHQENEMLSMNKDDKNSY